MKQKSLKFEFEGRFFQQGEIRKNTKAIFFVLHGHGQQAKYFIRKFEPLFDLDHCIIAPEGLSRYYLEGYSGRVGATWMTTEDRETDINNYTHYLNTLYASIKPKIGDKTRVYLLGFSQGAATASRWAASEAMNFHKLVLWAGIFPPDMNFPLVANKYKGKEILYIYGSQDPFLSESKMQEMKTLSKKLKISPRIIQFQGGHDIETESLKAIL